MDLSCIISSGDLELYVLGMLPADEAEKITKLAELFPEIEEEINRISDLLLQTAESADAQPSPLLRDSVLQKLSDLKAEEETPPKAQVIEMRKKDQSTMKNPWLAAASLALVLTGTGLIYMFQQKNAERAIALEMGNKAEALQKELTGKEQQLQENTALLDLYKSNEFRKISLRQLPGTKPAEVLLFWSSKTSEVIMGPMDLPQPPAGKQYQLWAIVKGKPVDAGVITGGNMQKMRSFTSADAFAITLEKQGGSPTPTMEAMVAIANI